MTTEQQKAWLDEKWIRVRYGFHAVAVHGWNSGFYAKLPEAIAAAVTFTEQRIEHIGLVVEEIGVLRDYAEDQDGTWVGKVFCRILAREQVALAELRKGMRII